MSHLEDQLEDRIAELERERDAALRENAELREAIAIRCEQIREFVLWLDQYQPDVWERGLWSAHNAAIDRARKGGSDE